MKYKIIATNEIEIELNTQFKDGWEFVCFLPFMNSGVFGKQQILFKKRVKGG